MSRFLVATLTVLAVGCTSTMLPTATPSIGGKTLDVSNGTTLTVTIAVNGVDVGTVGPQASARIPAVGLPSTPWTVTAKSPTGRTLLTLAVPGLDVVGSNFGYGSRVDLSCGRLDVTVGPPLLGPALGSGNPGDCAP